MNSHLFSQYLFRCKDRVDLHRIFQALGTRIDNMTTVQKIHDTVRRVEPSKLEYVYRDYVRKYMSKT